MKQEVQSNHIVRLVLMVCAIMALMLAAGGLWGCSGTSSSTSSQKAISFTDTAGHAVNMDQPAQKVVTLDAASCEIVYALGAGDKVVGKGTYCIYPEESQSVPTLGSGSLVNVEQILALSPDLVITATMDTSADVITQLEKAGVSVLETDTGTIEGVYQDITNVGLVLGKSTEATTLVNSMKADFQELTDKAKAQANYGTKSIYFEASPLQYGLWAAGTGTFSDEIAQMLGVKNCFADVQDWGEVSEEQVISRNPDYIVTSAMGFGDEDPAQEILSRKGWESVSAVANNKVLSVSDDSLTVPGPRLVDGAKALYAFIYGE